MKTSNIIFSILSLLIIGLIAYGAFFKDQEVKTETLKEVVRDESIGLSFSYKGGEDGYVMTTHIKDEYADSSFVKLYTLMQKEDYDFFQTQTEATEGPPSLGITIFANPEGLSADMWVDGNPSLSNTGLLVGEIDRDVVIGGVDALRYMIDGLYKTQMVVVSNGGYIYVVSGAFLDEDSDIYRDFGELIDSFEFISATDLETVGTKIDPRVVCESALMYMTFENGDDADMFVSECIDGKYPEVIDKYILENVSSHLFQKSKNLVSKGA